MRVIRAPSSNCVPAMRSVCSPDHLDEQRSLGIDAARGVALVDVDAHRRGHDLGVDRVDAGLGEVREEPAQHVRGDDRRVDARELTRVAAHDVAQLATVELRRERADLLGQDEIRLEPRQLLGQHRRRVDRVARGSAREVFDDLVGDVEGDVHLRLAGAGAEVRRHHHLLELEQRIRGIRRLLGEHVDGGPGDVAVADRIGERLLVDDAAARDVDQARALAHPLELGGADHAAGGVGQRDVDGEEVSFRQQRLKVAELDARLLRAFGGDQRVVGEHAHAQPLAGDACHLGSDLAETEDAERLLAQLDAHELRALPEAGMQGAVGGGKVAREREHHRDGVLGGRDRVAGGCVEHEHAVPRRRLDVDVVDADTGASDHAQSRRGGEHLGGDLGLAANHERVVVADALAERARLEPGHDVDLARGAQACHAVLGDRVRNEDARHGAGRGARLRGDAHPTLTGSA